MRVTASPAMAALLSLLACDSATDTTDPPPGEPERLHIDVPTALREAISAASGCDTASTTLSFLGDKSEGDREGDESIARAVRVGVGVCAATVRRIDRVTHTAHPAAVSGALRTCGDQYRRRAASWRIAEERLQSAISQGEVLSAAELSEGLELEGGDCERALSIARPPATYGPDAH